MALNGFLEKASGGRRQSVSRSRALHTLPDMLFLLGSQKESFSRDAKSELSWEGQGHPDREQQQNASKSKHTLKGLLSLFGVWVSLPIRLLLQVTDLTVTLQEHLGTTPPAPPASCCISRPQEDFPKSEVQATTNTAMLRTWCALLPLSPHLDRDLELS